MYQLHLSTIKEQAVAQAVGLPNWDLAASPCLRSRLAPFVPAHERHLKIVELCEEKIRLVLGDVLHRSDALRVRMMETPDMDWHSGLHIVIVIIMIATVVVVVVSGLLFPFLLLSLSLLFSASPTSLQTLLTILPNASAVCECLSTYASNNNSSRRSRRLTKRPQAPIHPTHRAIIRSSYIQA